MGGVRQREDVFRGGDFWKARLPCCGLKAYSGSKMSAPDWRPVRRLGIKHKICRDGDLS